ncbi:MAG: hypothetical protein ACYS8X_03585 [Planctomycetota bacterium]|jgi:hypothetical protein
MADREKRGDSHMLLVGGMLLIVLAAVAALWLTERRKATGADQWRRRCQDLEQANKALEMIIRTQPARADVSLADLPSETITIEGEARTAYRLTTAQASELGLGEGELLVIPTPSPPDRTGHEAGGSAEH